MTVYIAAGYSYVVIVQAVPVIVFQDQISCNMHAYDWLQEMYTLQNVFLLQLVTPFSVIILCTGIIQWIKPPIEWTLRDRDTI